MVGAVLLILNDPIDRLLPAGAPALQPGPTTTWDPLVVATDGRIDWQAAREAGREPAPGSSIDAWPRLHEALVAAGLPQAEAPQSLKDLRAGRLPEPDPGTEARLRVAAEPVFSVLEVLGTDARFAVADPPGATRASALAGSPAQIAIRQLISAAYPTGDIDAVMRLQAASRLSALVPVAAGLEDLEGAVLAQRAEAGMWFQLVSVLAEQPGDGEVRRQVEVIRSGLREPAMPGALRRARLDALRACQALHDEVMSRANTQIRVNAPPDINHALGLLNRWFDSVFTVLPGDLADSRGLAVLATGIPPIPELDTAAFSDDRTLAARLLFERSVDERRRQTGAMLATLVEMRTIQVLLPAIRQARRAVLLRAALDAMLAVQPGASATRLAESLAAALPVLPPTGCSLVFKADGRRVQIVLQAAGTDETIATITTDEP